MNEITVRAFTKDKGDQKIGGNNYGQNADLAYKNYQIYLKTYKYDILEEIPESGEYIMIHYIGGDEFISRKMRNENIPSMIMIPIKYKNKFTFN